MKTQKLIATLCSTFALLFGLSSCQSSNVMAFEVPAKPNILFIFADDLSFNVIHAYGSKEVKTPHIDKLASTGSLFRNAYNMGAWNGAICVASRAMLNTGLFVWHAQKTNLKQAAGKKQFWSQYMKEAGYETYFTGKWHVKANATTVFDHTEHIRRGMPKQTPGRYKRTFVGKDTWSPYDTKFGGFWAGGKHWSEIVADDGINFLENAKKNKKPFFMYLAFNAAHDPRQAPKKYVDMYPLKDVKVPASFLPKYPYQDEMGCGRGLRDEKLAPFPRTPHSVKVNRQEYHAIITHMDDQIGRIIAALKKSGKYDNTIIIFTADHGLSVGNHGLIGKQNMYDHSVRVPFIITGPGIKNQTLETPIYLQDIMPTTIEWAGLKKPKQVAFKSLQGLLNNKTTQHYNSIYGGYKTLQRMVTKDKFKMIIYPKANNAIRLYDLNKDPEELKDLSSDKQYAAKLKELKREFLKLQKETGDSLKIF
jgi:arylsulfatase A-like enzyme